MVEEAGDSFRVVIIAVLRLSHEPSYISYCEVCTMIPDIQWYIARQIVSGNSQDYCICLYHYNGERGEREEEVVDMYQ